jgi:hypothetical protein
MVLDRDVFAGAGRSFAGGALAEGETGTRLMNFGKWVSFAVALGMIGATAGYLAKIGRTHRLGNPGVRVGRRVIYDDNGKVAAQQSVILPDEIMGELADSQPITTVELTGLPKDTTFGRSYYHGANGNVLVSVVLMGTDRTSIHQPQYCLEGQAWHIERTEQVLLPIDRPFPYELPAMKLTASRVLYGEHHEVKIIRGIYVYWFVTADKIAPDEGTRLWSIARTMVEKGELERWAYIAYFVTCLPGQEKVTYGHLERFIRASVPDFQVVAGKPSGQLSPVAVQP